MLHCIKNFIRQRWQKMGDCHVRNIWLSCYQQHLVLDVIPQGQEVHFLQMGVKIKLGLMVKSNVYKVRMVASCLTQTFGVNYNKFFALVLKFVLISATIEDMEFHQMDFKPAFINCDLKKKKYIGQFDRFTQGEEDFVYKLHKSLCGLK